MDNRYLGHHLHHPICTLVTQSNNMETPSLQQGIHDAHTLGPVKFGILGIQHLFAMFGATILVPAITGLNASATLLFAGVGTLLFHFISKWKVPAFLGSSFAFIGGYLSIKQLGMDKGLPAYLSLDYACIGVACAGLCYFIMAALRYITVFWKTGCRKRWKTISNSSLESISFWIRGTRGYRNTV